MKKTELPKLPDAKQIVTDPETGDVVRVLDASGKVIWPNPTPAPEVPA